MFEKIQTVSCALCGSSNLERLVPSRKLNTSTGTWEARRDIWICICSSCGLIAENPQVDVINSRDYNEHHYYNESYNQVEAHDELQNSYAEFRWEALRTRIDWSDIRKAVDVGATGAWSAKLKERQPHIESILLEPSRAAIDFCARKYPTVIPIHGVLEEFVLGANDIDLITLFYSLYHISDPVTTLRMCRKALAPRGKLMICISHAHLEIEMWGANRETPWVDMMHFVRGVMLTTFSRSTLKLVLELAGFRISDVFVATHQEDGRWRGRQDYFVLAESSGDDGAAVQVKSAERVKWAKDFVQNFCVNASHRSVAKFFEGKTDRKAVLVCDDDTYGNWAEGLLNEHNVVVSRIGTSNIDALRNHLSNKNAIVLNATWKPIDASASVATIVDCIQEAEVAGDYGLWTTGPQDEVIITKALLPTKDFVQYPQPRDF